MRYKMKVVKGEDALKELIRKMRGADARVRWTETIGHCENITVEMYYLRGEDDDRYCQYFLLYMPHDGGEWLDVSAMRAEMMRTIKQ